jgi:DNA replication ATP-dependent helicase Dna2
MITPDDLIDFLMAERRENEKQQRLHKLLSDEAMSRLGRGITGIMVSATNADVVTLECSHNESRIRPGSHVTLVANEQSRLNGEVVSIEDAGKTLKVSVGRIPNDLFSGPWSMLELDRDFTLLVTQAVRKLQPGAAGWSFFRALSDESGKIVDRKVTKPAERQLTVERLIQQLPFPVDASQREALMACVNEPALLGVQGPPGTGKTNLLSMVAESLARLGRRVLILAPTHQAVNNALATIHSAFPERKLVKVGNALRRESLPDDVECQLLRVAVRNDNSRTGSEKIIGMTFLSALQHLAVQSSGLAPNVVLIDEAGQLPLCQGMCAGLFGAGSTLLFGDDLQMPPVFNSELSSSPLATSLFTRLRKCHPASILMLNTSYRLNSEICDFVAESFYGGVGNLIASESSRDRRLSKTATNASPGLLGKTVMESEQSLIWIRTVEDGSQQLNLTEANDVAQLAMYAIECGLQPNELAVVTPYRRQAAAIRRFIQYLLGNQSSELPIVDTVERVQGLTVELVIISMCTTDPDYASENAGFVFSPNRLNVAISRARTKVVIFACEEILNALPTEYDGLIAMNKFKEALERIPVMS